MALVKEKEKSHDLQKDDKANLGFQQEPEPS